MSPWDALLRMLRIRRKKPAKATIETSHTEVNGVPVKVVTSEAGEDLTSALRSALDASMPRGPGGKPTPAATTPLYTAAKSADTTAEQIKALIADGGDVNAAYPGRGLGGTALHVAACVGNLAVCEALIEAGADVNAFIKDGHWIGATPVFMAAKKDHTDVVKLLVKSGAHLTDVHREEREAAMEEQSRCNERGDEEGAGAANHRAFQLQFCDPLNLAVNNGNTELLELLIANGSDLEGVAKYGMIVAAKYGYKSMMEILIKNGAEINFRHRTESPLTEAARLGWLDICELLIKAGADVTAPGFGGKSLLELADEPLYGPNKEIKPTDMKAKVQDLIRRYTDVPVPEN